MKVTCAILSVLLFCVACSSSGKEATTTTTQPRPAHTQGNIDFEQCGPSLCAEVKVPMDYDKPQGRKVTLALTMLPATKTSERIGVLFVNPGGPGASGNEFVQNNAAFIFSKEIRDHFDIVGWDPRGVGDSTSVTCSSSLDPLFDGVDYSPDTDEDIEKLKEASRWIGEKCEKEDAELLTHLNTPNTVKDLDSLRGAFGEDQLNYLGFSYGTAIGQMYATQYPDKIRTMVLDGVVDTTRDPQDTAVEQAHGFEDAIDNFFDYCRENRCNFSGSSDPRESYEAIVEQIDANPMVSRADQDFYLGPAQLDIGTSQYLYSGETGWKTLDRGLVGIRNNDPTLLLDGFNTYVGRGPQGQYDGSYASFLSIGCADGRIGDEDHMIALSKTLVHSAPIFGQSGILLGLPCASWPDAVDAESFELDATGPAPILVIGTTGDPATPVQWARDVAFKLDNGVYLEKIGEGHTAFGQGQPCIDDTVNQYFLTGEKPTTKKCS